MVRKKRNSKQFSSKQIFITLLIVLIVAFGAIFLFSGSDETIAGQAIGDQVSSGDLAGKEVYIQSGSDTYLCVTAANYLYACEEKEDTRGTHWFLEAYGNNQFFLKHMKTGKYLFAKSGEHINNDKGYTNTFIYLVPDTTNNGAVWEFDASKGPNYGLKSFGKQYVLIRDSKNPISVELHNKYYPTKSNSYSSEFVVFEAPLTNLDNIINGFKCSTSDYLKKIGVFSVGSKKASLLCGKPPFACDPSGLITNSEVMVTKGNKLMGFNQHLCTSSGDWSVCGATAYSVDKQYRASLGEVKEDYTCGESTWELTDVKNANVCSATGVSKDRKELCYNKKTVKCDTWRAPENYEGKYLCPGIAPYEWLVCGGSENKNSIDKDGNRYCDGKVWINCNTEQSKKDWGEALFCDAKSDEWNLCNINTKDTLSIKGSLCDGSKWVDCDNPHADTSSSDGKYTCDGNIWETTEEINYDLQSGFEVRFTKEKPADVKGFGGLLSFCDTDNQHIDNFLVTCINKVPLTKVLDKDILYPTTIGQENVAFLYQYKDDQKIGSVFLRKDLSPKELDYEANEFVDAMVKGRRIALQFENQIYLLEHPKSNLFSLQNLKMKIYEDSTEETYDAKGSPNKVEFILPEGKITVQLDTSGNAGFYKLSALTKSQIVSQEIDLNEELSVKMSSEYGVKITDNPNFGIVKVNEDPKTGDSNLEAEFFKIVVEKEDKKYILEKNVPKVIKKGDVSALFYYDTINKQTNKAIKSLQIFQHFDLSKNKFHDYNNEFIKTFTGGNEFVVQYGKGYYRVGYAEKPTDQVTLFSLQKLILTSLDGKNKYVPKEANSKKVTFIVPEGGVVFEKKVDDNKLEFYKQTAVELTTQEFNADDYSTFLTKETPVKVNKVTYQLKDSGFTSTLDTQARIIEGNNEDTFKVLKKDQVEPIDGHLFWFKGKNAKGLKEISVQPIVEIKEGQKKTIDDWGDILAKAKDAKSKAILWQGEYFDLVGDKKLASYSLRSIPEGDTFPIKNIKVADDETENGTFAFHEHLLFATQVLDLKTTEASLELTPLTHKLLTSTGLNSTSHGKTLSFVTTVGGPLYVMTHSTVNKNLFVVGSLFTPAKSFLKMLIPEGKSTKILFPDLTLGTIEVLNTTTSEIRITK
jgi:hypothetical protein